jgi:hypothetical protein
MQEVEVNVRTFGDERPPVFTGMDSDSRTAYISYTYSSGYESGVPQMYDIIVPLTDEERESHEDLLTVDPSGVTGVPMNRVVGSRITQV